MPSQQTSQIRLSESCQTVVRKYDDEYAQDNSVEEELWDCVGQLHKDMCSYTDDAKAEMGITENVVKITKYFDKISVLREARKNAEHDGQPEKAVGYSQTIREDFRVLVEETKELQKKAYLIENQKLQDIETGWASSVLTDYYNIISNAGGIQDAVDKLKVDLQQSKLNKRTVENSLLVQISKLNLIAPVIENFKNMNGGFPPELKEKLSCIDNRLVEFRGLYEENKMTPTQKTGKVLELHDKLTKELYGLYKETIKKSVKG